MQNELARPFLPTLDFEKSKQFYLALGFELTLDSEVAIFKAGSGGFLLQRHYHKDWAGNFMMQLMVDDLDHWWSHIQSLDLAKRFGVPAPKPPAVQPWGSAHCLCRRSVWSFMAYRRTTSGCHPRPISHRRTANHVRERNTARSITPLASLQPPANRSLSSRSKLALHDPSKESNRQRARLS